MAEPRRHTCTIGATGGSRSSASGGGRHAGSVRRRAGFVGEIERLGYTDQSIVVDIPGYDDNENSDARALAQALQADRRPIGCFAFEDMRAMTVLGQCRQLGIDVPGRVGVIGAGDDDYLCETQFPTLTSMDIGQEARGYEAGRVLAELMDGKTIQTPVALIPPGAVIVRGSTGFATTDDPMVDKAIAFIHDHADQDICVDDVVDHVKSNRRTLERRFRAALGLSPHQQILRTRVEHVKQLLLTTDMDIGSVTRASGFHYSAHMTSVFRKLTGQTPMEFRGRR